MPLPDNRQGGSNSSPQNPKTTELASQDVLPSEKAQTLIWKDQVKITLPAGAVESKQTLTISKATGLPAPSFKGLVGMEAFDISIGNIHRLPDGLVIELAFDPATIKSDLPMEKAIVVMSWNPEQGIWVTERSNVDTQRNVITIRTDHLSTFKPWWIPSGWAVNQTKHFNVVFDPKEKGSMMQLSTSAQRQGSKITVPVPMDKMAANLGAYLDQSWEEFSKYKFLMPEGDDYGRLWVYLDSSLTTSQKAKFSSDLYFATTYTDDQYKDGTEQLRHEAAHELFHAIQNRYYWFTEMVYNRWWMEATADYAADAVAMGGSGTMPLVPADYFNTPITSSEGFHMYKTSRFVAFMAKSAGGFKEMWDAVAKGSSVTLGIDQYLKSIRSSSLSKEFRSFIPYVLFDTTGPLSPTILDPQGIKPVLDKGLLYSPAIEKADVMEAVKTDISYQFKTIPQFSAGILGIVVKTQTGQKRSFMIERTPVGDSDQTIDVFILKGDTRLSGGIKPAGTITRSSPKVDLGAVENDDVIYLVNINGGDVATGPIVVKITEVSSAKWVRVGKVEKVEPLPDSALAKGAFPVTATFSGTTAKVVSQTTFSQVVNTVVQQSLLAASRWQSTWTEPPQELTAGQKWNGKITLNDAGSEAPKGGYRLVGNIQIWAKTSGDIQRITEITNAVPADRPHINSQDFSWTVLSPAGSGTTPQQMSIFIQTTANGRNTAGGDDLMTNAVVTMEYKYELRK